jgi:signal transduction histidine kinase
MLDLPDSTRTRAPEIEAAPPLRLTLHSVRDPGALMGALLAALGAAVLCGWWLQSDPLIRIFADYPPMAVGTALCFVIAGIALMLSEFTPHGPAIAHTALAAMLAAIAAGVLIDRQFDLHLGIVWSIATGSATGAGPPSRTPSGNAAAFLMASVVLLVGRRVHRSWQQWLVLALTAAVGVIGVIGFGGFWLKADLLFPRYPFIGVALHSTIGLMLLATGLHFFIRRQGWATQSWLERDDDRITFVSAAVLMAITVITCAAIFAVLASRGEALVRENLVAGVAHRQTVFADVIEMYEGNARLAASRPAVHRNVRMIHAGVDPAPNLANVTAVVDGFLKQGLSGIAYYDMDGKLVAGGGRFETSASISVPLATPGKGELVWNNGLFLRHRLPMEDASGKVGEVAVEQPLPTLTRLLRHARETGDTWDIGLCTRRGERLDCFPQRLNPVAFSTPLRNIDGKPLPMSRALEGETGAVITRDYRGQKVLAAFAPVGDLGLGMVMKVDAAEVFQPIREQLLSAIGVLLLLIAAGTMLLRSQVRPLVTRLVSTGSALRQLNGELEERVRERTAGLARAQAMARLAHVITRPDGSFDSWSDTFLQLAGRSDAELPRTTRAWLEIVHQDDRALFRKAALDARTTGKRTEVSYRLHWPDGRVVHVLQSMEPLGEEEPSPSGFRWFNTLQDVTAQQQAEDEIRELNEHLEARVRQRTVELEAVNRELEAFSYSVSHDLRAPLRHIDGFAELLKEDAASKLSAEGSRFLDVISRSAKQLGRLIDDLLGFSRMGRSEMNQGDVDMARLCREVAADVMQQAPGRTIEWDIAPLPVIRGDSAMLKQVWVNLLANAVKYTRNREAARIEVDFARHPAEFEFYVRDNGAGFDPKYADKLFGVFQRLHRAEEFEGTGVGLANVRRIVSRHGGRTRAEGEPGIGATFYFTLPAEQRNHP